ncbi:succinate--hydroxymethylglutarate CoA-transferase-like [Seriola lalandi dorsalis]|uniref:succinate--hydroxymethylglutarate CoA-transferase-like n=1 Tax=Seriola lalandi dorsalis TaxID=1841481 RepID=UPI000C6F7539|nr:succinate--hydroxymethylglutarate CoA-transferase-like [Seriola lalandi dorsalis]
MNQTRQNSRKTTNRTSAPRGSSSPHRLERSTSLNDELLSDPQSIAVDLKHPRGAQIIQQLTGVCDVLVENYLPGKLHQMGLGYEQLSRVNPRLIYCSISGYGQTGPQSQSPGYDSIASAVSGMMHITGPEDGEPVRPGVAMTDLATGLYAHGAVMAALLQRHKTGRGVHIDCNLLSSQDELPA